MADQLISERVMAIVGNTLLVYQAIEHLMKDIARSSDVSAPLSKVEKTVKKRAKDVASSTMGGVVKEEYLKIFEPLTFTEADDVITEISLRVKVEISTCETERKAWAKEIEELVAERNWVVHQSVLGLNAQEIAVRERAVEKVRACNAHAHKVYSRILHHSWANACASQGMVAALLGGQFQKLIGTALKVTGLMHDRKTMKPDKDGWVPVERLQTRCKEKYGDDLKEACAVTQTKSVLEFLKKQMGGIEIKEHKTKNGMRMMFRMPS